MQQQPQPQQPSAAKPVMRATIVDQFDTRNLYLEPRHFLTVRRIENALWYPTNASNQKYVRHYELKYKSFTLPPPNRIPSHPRERHRCDFHLSDFYASVTDRKASIWGTAIQFLKCVESDPGDEPERLRDEYWISG